MAEVGCGILVRLEIGKEVDVLLDRLERRDFRRQVEIEPFLLRDEDGFAHPQAPRPGPEAQR